MLAALDSMTKKLRMRARCAGLSASSNAPINGLAGLNLSAQRGLPGQPQQLGHAPGIGQPQPQQQQQSIMSAEALYLAQLQRMSQPAQIPLQQPAGNPLGLPSYLQAPQQGGALKPAGKVVPMLPVSVC